MISEHTAFRVNLFYSYSHVDSIHRSNMEKHLKLLSSESLVDQWSDRQILPGERISEKIQQKIDEADIFVFLLSPDFIDSDECRKEWNQAKEIKNRLVFRVPVILRECSWEDFLGKDDVRAIPTDGKSITSYDDQDVAWKEVYKGIKSVVERIKNTFSLKAEFQSRMEKTEFISEENVKLQDIFVFLPLRHYTKPKNGQRYSEKLISNLGDLLKEKYVLIHGEQSSGKTALGRYMFLALAEQQSNPVLYIDCSSVNLRRANSSERIEILLQKEYHLQFNGDFHIWKKQEEKILILDDLSQNDVDFLVAVKEFFNKIFVTLSSDIFISFLRDEVRLAFFQELEIKSLTHNLQEDLIRKRLALIDGIHAIPDGKIDKIEEHVNSIIISNRFLPRYPFFVLSILQTYEGYMPRDLSITSYGHCYYMLIFSFLIKSGISKNDSEINSCLNFAERLAFSIYEQNSMASSKFEFDSFLQNYRREFYIKDAIINRLKGREYGIINNDGSFKHPYMYHFFLGRFLAKNNEKYRNFIEEMCNKNYIISNHLTLLFIIHHLNDEKIIDYLLQIIKNTISNVSPATLSQEETKTFSKIVDALPKNLLSSGRNVEKERERERTSLDKIEEKIEQTDESDTVDGEDENSFNDIYKILKSNEIMGSILRNKYGLLPKTKIEDIIEIVADGGLRLVNLVLGDQDEIERSAHYIHSRSQKYNLEDIKTALQYMSIFWIITNIEHIVRNINTPEIRKSVSNVVQKKDSPAYHMIEYFCQLANALELTEKEKASLQVLLRKHRYSFFERIVSLKTQYYMKTHRSKAPIEQSICSLLRIQYRSTYHSSE